MKKCPYCAEQIQDDSIKCRYCGEMLAVPDRQAGAGGPAGEIGSRRSSERSRHRRRRARVRWFVVLLLLPAALVVAVAVLWSRGGSDRVVKLGEGASAPSVRMPSTRWTQLAGSSDNGCGLTDGTAWCWGSDDSGQLGDGPETGDASMPAEVAIPEDVVFSQITVGDRYACALDAEGAAWCWGSDEAGQLGNGAISGAQHSPSPVDMPAGVSFTSISAGPYHVCALDEQGVSWCWGAGYLGDGSMEDGLSLIPTEVRMPAGLTFVQISVSYRFSCALSGEASLWCWGDGLWGARGQDGDEAARGFPTAIPNPGGRPLSRVANGPFHLCALASDGTVWCWGWLFDDSREFGSAWDAEGGSGAQMAAPEGRKFVDLTSGGGGTCAAAADGSIICWLQDRDAGSIAAVTATVPEGQVFTSIVGGIAPCALTSEGYGWCWRNGSSRPSPLDVDA